MKKKIFLFQIQLEDKNIYDIYKEGKNLFIRIGKKDIDILGTANIDVHPSDKDSLGEWQKDYKLHCNQIVPNEYLMPADKHFKKLMQKIIGILEKKRVAA